MTPLSFYPVVQVTNLDMVFDLSISVIPHQTNHPYLLKHLLVLSLITIPVIITLVSVQVLTKIFLT